MEFEVDGVKVIAKLISIKTEDLDEHQEIKRKLDNDELVLVDKKKLDRFFFEFCELKKEVVLPNEETKTKNEETLLSNIVEKGPEVFEDVKEIFENNQDPEVKSGMKPWFKSKTIITNILTAIGCVVATFVSDDPNASMYSVGSIVATINLYLRSITKSEIKLPLEDKIKGNEEI